MFHQYFAANMLYLKRNFVVFNFSAGMGFLMRTFLYFCGAICIFFLISSIKMTILGILGTTKWFCVFTK